MDQAILRLFRRTAWISRVFFTSALLRHTLALVAWIGLPAVVTVTESWAETHQVTIQDNVFDPSQLAISPGDTVVWTNLGSDHTVTADDESFHAVLEFGQTFSRTFPAIGRYPYYCQLHGSPGADMAGAVRVADPLGNEPPAQPVNGAPQHGATNVSIAPTLTASAFSDPNIDDLHAASQWIVRLVGGDDVVFDSGESAANLTSIVLSDLMGGTSYTWQLRYKDDRGAWSTYSAPTEFTTVAAPIGDGTGLLATYGTYNLKRNLFVPKTTLTDAAVNFDWGVKRANASTPANNFFVRWEGTILPEFSERYRFRVRADGGVRLWINGQLIVDDWVTWKFPIYRNGTAELDAGVSAAIKLEYFDTAGSASCTLRWSSSSRPVEVVPQVRLFPLDE